MFMFPPKPKTWAASPAGSIEFLAMRNCPKACGSICAARREACMRLSRASAWGLILSVALVYLILVAQFKSFVDPFLILLAVPTGLTGVMLTLVFTGTT